MNLESKANRSMLQTALNLPTRVPGNDADFGVSGTWEVCRAARPPYLSAYQIHQSVSFFRSMIGIFVAFSKDGAEPRQITR